VALAVNDTYMTDDEPTAALLNAGDANGGEADDDYLSVAAGFGGGGDSGE